MFERYTEKARRVVFFARYEASQFGSPYIETEHLLLGLLREDKALTNRLLQQQSTVEDIRKEIEEHTLIREKVSTSVDLPLSNESKRALVYASEDAEKMGHRHIGTEHLLLGLLREEKGFAATILVAHGVTLDGVRAALASASVPGQRAVSSAGEQRPGLIQFLGPDGEQIAISAMARVVLIPRSGEIVSFEMDGERRRFTVKYLEFVYDTGPESSPPEYRWISSVIVHIAPLPEMGGGRA